MFVGINKDLEVESNKVTKLEEACRNKDAKLTEAFNELESLYHKLDDLALQAESEEWYKVDIAVCGYRIPLRATPDRRSNIFNYITGEAVSVKRYIQDGFQELADGTVRASRQD